MSSTEPLDRSAAGYGAYKYQWARYVARKSLDAEIQALKKEIPKHDFPLLPNIDAVASASTSDNPTGPKLREIAQGSKEITFGKPPEVDGKFSMGIVGSGIAGLFTAALIEELNRQIPELDISYDILEAGGRKRLGGRLYTHRFPELDKSYGELENDDGTKRLIGSKPQDHQYYDVGAMRFPENEVMERTFRLFDFLDIKKGGNECPRLVPYYLGDELKVCPTYFNHQRIYGEVDFKTEYDPYKVNEWLPPKSSERIKDSVLRQKPGDVVGDAIAVLTKKLRDDMDVSAKKNNPLESGEADPGWKALMQADFLTTREFFRRKGPIDNSGIEGLDYNFNTIEWLETYAYATGWYNQSLAETVLETLDFAPPKGKRESNDYWYCIEGGTQLLAEKLADKLAKQPEFNKQVTAIETDLTGTGNVILSTRTTPPDGWDREKEFKPIMDKKSYFTVFNSTTLGALQKMDLSKANLLYGTKQAIRSLNYGASCKVAIQFKRMWWQDKPWNIKRGGLGKTDLPLRVCVYPSYNTHDKIDKPGVLLCSYSWAQDAQRIGTHIDPKSPQNEGELVELMLSNLAQLHAIKDNDEYTYEKVLKTLRELYITHHAYDWYHDPNMSGAFGYFGPGQFSQMWPEIIKPNGWLFLIGEAASAHHGWIVGALESSVRAMYQLLHMLNNQVLKRDGIPFPGYTKAIKFLEGPEDKNDKLWKLPFVGLPREIPVRQIGTQKGDAVQEIPEEKDVDLSFVAAQVITSFYQMVLELAKEEEAAAASSSAGTAST